MTFKKIRGLKMPYKRQAHIWSTCQNYDIQPEDLKTKIIELCDKVDKIYAKELFDIMCSEKSIVEICYDSHISNFVAYEIRRKFYVLYEKEVLRKSH